MCYFELSYLCITTMKTSIFHKESKQQFEQIYNRYSGRIYNYAMQLSKGDAYLSEEIVQIVFIQLWEHFSELRDQEKVLSYLFTTVKRTFLNYCEHEAVEFLYADYVLTHGNEADTQMEEQQNLLFIDKYIKDIVSHMPPMRQRVFTMSRFQQMTNKQIAEQLGISEKTVEVHITLAIKELRAKLKL